MATPWRGPTIQYVNYYLVLRIFIIFNFHLKFKAKGFYTKGKRKKQTKRLKD